MLQLLFVDWCLVAYCLCDLQLCLVLVINGVACLGCLDTYCLLLCFVGWVATVVSLFRFVGLLRSWICFVGYLLFWLIVLVGLLLCIVLFAWFVSFSVGSVVGFRLLLI